MGEGANGCSALITTRSSLIDNLNLANHYIYDFQSACRKSGCLLQALRGGV